MAYGIEIFSSNNTLQLGTTAQENLTVIDTGTVASSASVTYDGLNEILCFNRSTTGWVDGNTNSTATSWTNTSGVTVNWLKLKRASTNTEDDSGTYGIKVFKSDGTSINFSSNYSKGQDVLAVISPGTVSSTGTAITQSPIIYSGAPSGVYVGVGRMVFSVSASQYQAYETLYFDYTSNVIRSRNLFGFDIGTGFTYLGYPNKSSLIVFNRNG